MFLKPHLHQKRSWSLWWSAASLAHYSFLSSSKTITSEKYAHIHHRSVLTMRWHWTPCRQRWSSPSLLHGNAWPHSHNQCFESWMKWATEFCLILHIHLTSSQSTTTFSSISPAFCRENTSKTSRMQEMFSKSLLNPKA